MTLKFLLSTQSPTTSKNFSHHGDFHNNEEAEMSVREWLRRREDTCTAMEFFGHCQNGMKIISMPGDYLRNYDNSRQ